MRHFLLQTDKLAHMLVSALIVMTVAFADMHLMGRPLAVATGIGVFTSLILGFIKETCDYFFKNYGTGVGFDTKDYLADIIGTAVGSLIVVLLTLYS